MNVTVLSSVVLFILILVGCRVLIMSLKAGDDNTVTSFSNTELTKLLKSNEDLKERINNLELIITNIDETELKLQAIKLSKESKRTN